MQVSKDVASIHNVVINAHEPELVELLNSRIVELLEYADVFADLIHILVIEPSDALTDVDAELGFSLADRPWDVIESHPGWYEITVVVSDDGFGWVIYVPKHASTDAALLEKCTNYCKGSMP